MNETEISTGMDTIEEAFRGVANTFDEIELLTDEQAPHGLMEKARTISWLVEQIYVQNLSESPETYGLETVSVPADDLIVYDLEITVPDNDIVYYANVKTGLTTSAGNKNDVSKSSKLARFFYEQRDKDSVLLTIPVRVDFDGDKRAITLREDCISVHNLHWVNSDDIYVNPSNKNLQCSLDKPSQTRSKQAFLDLLLNGDSGMVDAVSNRGATETLITKEELGFDRNTY